MRDPYNYEPNEDTNSHLWNVGHRGAHLSVDGQLGAPSTITEKRTRAYSLLAGVVVRDRRTDAIQIIHGQIAETANGSRTIIPTLRLQ